MDPRFRGDDVIVYGRTSLEARRSQGLTSIDLTSA